MSLSVKLRNLYIDREIQGEFLLVPFKRTNQFIEKKFSHPNLFSDPLYLISKIATYLFLGPLAIFGMAIKCLHVHQVREYNEKIKQKLFRHQTLVEYPNQPDPGCRYSLSAGSPVLTQLDEATKMWKRLPCNIVGYLGSDVCIQFIQEAPNWRMPEGIYRPFEG